MVGVGAVVLSFTTDISADSIIPVDSGSIIVGSSNCSACCTSSTSDSIAGFSMV